VLSRSAWNYVRDLVSRGIKPSLASVRQCLQNLRADPDPTRCLQAARVFEALGTPLDNVEAQKLVGFLLRAGKPVEAMCATQELAVSTPMALKTRVLKELLERNYLSEAREYFTHFHSPNITTYTMYAHKLARIGRTSEAMRIVKFMLSNRSLAMDEAAYRTVLFVLAAANRPREAATLLRQLESTGWKLGPDAYTTVMAKFQYLGPKSQAEAVAGLQQEIETREIPWTSALTTAKRRAFDVGVTQRVLDRMETNRYSTHTAERMVIAAAKGSATAGLQLYNKLLKQGYRFHPRTTSRLVQELSYVGKLSDAVPLARPLLSLSDLDDRTANVLIRLFSRLESADALTEHVFAKLTAKRRPNVSTYRAMANFYLLRRRVQEAEELLKGAVAQGEADESLYNLFVHRASTSEEAWRRIEEMRSVHLRPDKVTFKKMLYRAINRPERAGEVERILAQDLDGSVHSEAVKMLVGAQFLCRADDIAHSADEKELKLSSEALSLLVKDAANDASVEILCRALRLVEKQKTVLAVRAWNAVADMDVRSRRVHRLLVLLRAKEIAHFEALAATASGGAAVEKIWSDAKLLGFSLTQRFSRIRMQQHFLDGNLEAADVAFAEMAKLGIKPSLRVLKILLRVRFLPVTPRAVLKLVDELQSAGSIEEGHGEISVVNLCMECRDQIKDEGLRREVERLTADKNCSEEHWQGVARIAAQIRHLYE